jgi:hypothetical protein
MGGLTSGDVGNKAQVSPASFLRTSARTSSLAIHPLFDGVDLPRFFGKASFFVTFAA